MAYQKHEKYILTNKHFGGFSIPIEIISDFFKYCVLTNSDGLNLFNELKLISLDSYDQKPFFTDNINNYVYLFCKRTDDDDDEYYKNIIENPTIVYNTTTNKCYQLSEYSTDFRDSKAFIDYLFKQTDNMQTNYFYELYTKFMIHFAESWWDIHNITFGQEINYVYPSLDMLEELGYSQDDTDKCVIVKHGDEYYMKLTKRYDLPDPTISYYVLSITFDNWKSHDNLCSYIVTYYNHIQNLKLNKLKSGYKHTIHEYDGAESVRFTLDYSTVIKSLLSKLQTLNIKPYETDPEFVKKLMTGEINIDDL